jgi:hypothetical protein
MTVQTTRLAPSRLRKKTPARPLRPGPILGKFFTLNASHLLEEARQQSLNHAARIRRNRVRSRNAQLTAIEQELRRSL